TYPGRHLTHGGEGNVLSSARPIIRRPMSRSRTVASTRRHERICQDSLVNPIEVEETEPGRYSLWLEAGTTNGDDLISELGHTPNGYFWEGIVELLVTSEACGPKGRFSCDPEAGAFCAHSHDRVVLEDLAARLRSVATGEDQLRHLVQLAAATG